MAGPTVTSPLELDDIQALVLRSHRDLPWASYLFFRIDDPIGARAALVELAGELTSAGQVIGRGPARPERRLQLALSAVGLERLGLDEQTRRSFAPEFQSGMAERTRSRRLGDRGASDPSTWELGGPGHRLDLLLCLFARERHERDALAAAYTERLAPALIVERREDSTPRPDSREHFGFLDGVSQPVIAGDPRRHQVSERDLIAPGEFLLGYPNEYRQRAPSPVLASGGDLGKNGSYLVFRKLEQDVAAFWRTFHQAAQTMEPARSAEHLAAKCVGRWPSGAPLSLSPERDDPQLGADVERRNEFLFLERDRLGECCPVASHIRRANPRDAKGGSAAASLELVRRRRLIRRGRLYGEPVKKPMMTEPDHVSRGLYFVALNANLSRQFEFLQQTWINNPKFGGLNDDRDPVSSQGATSGAASLPGMPFRQRLMDLPSFVTVRGGEYFFLPGLRALSTLLAACRP